MLLLEGDSSVLLVLLLDLGGERGGGCEVVALGGALVLSGLEGLLLEGVTLFELLHLAHMETLEVQGLLVLVGEGLWVGWVIGGLAGGQEEALVMLPEVVVLMFEQEPGIRFGKVLGFCLSLDSGEGLMLGHEHCGLGGMADLQLDELLARELAELVLLL